MAIEKKMKYKNRQAAGDLVDHWNHVCIALIFFVCVVLLMDGIVLFWAETDGGGVVSGV